MAPPHGEAAALASTYTTTKPTARKLSKPPRLSTTTTTDTLSRTISDISFQLSKEVIEDLKSLPPISEVEDAKCECCGMSEECTPEYIARVRNSYGGKWICGLCSEAIKEEMEKNGGKSEEALSTHMNACARFNKFGRAFPVLSQAAAMREILKKSRGSSISPKNKAGQVKGGLARSSSCIPALTREINDLTLAN